MRSTPIRPCRPGASERSVFAANRPESGVSFMCKRLIAGCSTPLDRASPAMRLAIRPGCHRGANRQLRRLMRKIGRRRRSVAGFHEGHSQQIRQKFASFGLRDLHQNLEHLLDIVVVGDRHSAVAGDKILVRHTGALRTEGASILSQMVRPLLVMWSTIGLMTNI